MLAADTGGQPRWVASNRAVSTAYYALFHAIAELCGRELVGAWRPFKPFQHIYRSVDHGQALRVFKSIKGDAEFGQACKDLAQIFIDLQDERHSADYDPGNRVLGAELAGILTRTELGIDLLSPTSPPQSASSSPPA